MLFVIRTVTIYNGRAETERPAKKLLATEQFNRPYVVTISDHVSDFFKVSMQENVLDMAVCLEAYLLSGVSTMSGAKARSPGWTWMCRQQLRVLQG